VGFGANFSDGVNANNEVVLNLKVKLTCDTDGQWKPSWVGLEDMDSKSTTIRPLPEIRPAQQPKTTKVWKPIGPCPLINKNKAAQVIPGGSSTTKMDLQKPISSLSSKQPEP
jgi:hypothetical protein